MSLESHSLEDYLLSARSCARARECVFYSLLARYLVKEDLGGSGRGGDGRGEWSQRVVVVGLTVEGLKEGGGGRGQAGKAMGRADTARP